MLGGVRLVLLCLMAIATPARANDGGDPVRAAQVTLSPTAQPAPRAASTGPVRGKHVDWLGPSGSLLPQRREWQASAVFPWLRQGPSGLAVGLTRRLRVGLGYRHLEGEDLWPEFADTGASNYDSHHLLIRASWRF